MAVLSTCPVEPAHVNAEYSAGTLTIHCHVAHIWVQIERPPPGMKAEMVAVLVMVPASSLPAGTIRVAFENRVERWLHDVVSTATLGVVTTGA